MNDKIFSFNLMSPQLAEVKWLTSIRAQLYHERSVRFWEAYWKIDVRPFSRHLPLASPLTSSSTFRIYLSFCCLPSPAALQSSHCHPRVEVMGQVATCWEMFHVGLQDVLGSRQQFEALVRDNVSNVLYGRLLSVELAQGPLPAELPVFVVRPHMISKASRIFLLFLLCCYGLAERRRKREPTDFGSSTASRSRGLSRSVPLHGYIYLSLLSVSPRF